MAEARVQLPLGALGTSGRGKAWHWRVRRAHEIFGSNPTVLTRLRWGPCWYGRAPVKRHVAGSIPATAAYSRKPSGRMRSLLENRWRQSAACGFEWAPPPSGGLASACWGHGPTGRRRLRKSEIRVQFPVTPLTTVPWSNGHDTWPTPRKRWFNSIRDHWERMKDEG